MDLDLRVVKFDKMVPLGFATCPNRCTVLL
jgi:hypothetical protein